MKFKQLSTGAMLETNNEFVIGQLKKSADYEEVKEFTKKEEPVEEKPVEKTEKKKND
jgi:hypothetical protein